MLSKDVLSLILCLKRFPLSRLLELRRVSKRWDAAITQNADVIGYCAAARRMQSPIHSGWWGQQLHEHQSLQIIESFMLWEKCFSFIVPTGSDYPIIRKTLIEEPPNKCEYFLLPGTGETTWPERLVVVGFVTLASVAHFAVICNENQIAFACRAGDDGALHAAKRLLQLLTSEINPIGFDVTFNGDDIEESVRNWFSRIAG